MSRRVYEDAIEGWVSLGAAEEIYGVVLRADDSEDGVRIDREATAKLRASRANAPADSETGNASFAPAI